MALGSDFDGALMPRDLSDGAAAQNLIALMQAHGYGDDLTAKIAMGNWLDLLARTWGEAL